jgi:hypothetical protein
VTATFLNRPIGAGKRYSYSVSVASSTLND